MYVCVFYNRKRQTKGLPGNEHTSLLHPKLPKSRKTVDVYLSDIKGKKREKTFHPKPPPVTGGPSLRNLAIRVLWKCTLVNLLLIPGFHSPPDNSVVPESLSFPVPLVFISFFSECLLLLDLDSVSPTHLESSSLTRVRLTIQMFHMLYVTTN